MEKTYEICFYGGLVLAIIALIIAVILFFMLKIPKVVGELTGHAARKSMKEMKEGGVKTGSVAKKEQEKYYNMGTGKIKVKEAVSAEKRKAQGDDSTELLGKNRKPELREEETSVLASNKNMDDDVTDILTAGEEGDDGATEILAVGVEGDDGATEVLTADVEGDDGATEVLTADVEGDDGATEVLTADTDETDEATSVLASDEDESEEGTSILTLSKKKYKNVKVLYNVVVTHTDESLKGRRL